MNGDKLNEALKSGGYSMTKSRFMVFEALGAQESQTMSALVQRLEGQVDRASIYRIVKLFEKLGIVARTQQGWKYRLELSSDFSYHHHHLTCSSCGRDVPVHENSLLEYHIQNFLAAHGFKRDNHYVEIRGLCQACQVESAKLP